MHFTNFNKCSPSQLLYTLVAFKQHCTRLVQRYLQTSDGKRQKLLVERTSSTLTEDVVEIENVRGRMEQSPRKSVRKLSLQTGVTLILKHTHPKFFVGHV
jgi:hypothetical protein